MEQMKYVPHRLHTILANGLYYDYNFVIVSYGTHPCAYVRLPKEHKYFNKNYNDIPICVHGSLTFSGNLTHLNIGTADDFYIGWDYAHIGDFNCGYPDYYASYINLMAESDKASKKWTTEEIFEDVKDVIIQLEELAHKGD